MTGHSSKNVRCGLCIPTVPEISNAINQTLEHKFTYLVCPIINPRFKREQLNTGLNHTQLPLTRSDLTLNAECWQSYVVAKLSRHYNCDSDDYVIRKSAVEGLTQELRFIGHLNLTTLLIPLRSIHIDNFARILNSFLLNRLIMFNILISIPVMPFDSNDQIENESNGTEPPVSPWYWWRKMRSLCEETSKLGLALVVTEDINLSDEELDRWYSEPVKALIIPTSVFLTNRNGFPVLSKPHQKFVVRFFKLKVDIIIEGTNRHVEKGLNKYYEYMNFLFKTKQEEPTLASKFTHGYEDCLQNPLQPLMDNLESQVYEVFEKDPVKYQQYQKAIAQALLDRVSDNDKLVKETVIMVVGAGRGPLVKAAMQASFDTQRKVKLYAIEKNLNAINTLLNLKNDEWGDKVTIVSSDMREWKAPEKADILVSELLGSVGDNELSPECLNGAESFLKEDGISIPYRYRSFIAPVQSYKLYTEVKKCKEYEYPFEAPYVVLLHNHCRIDEEKLLFQFEHPDKSEKIDNNRFGKVDFKARFDATIHGIAGYFDSHLYKDIDISITPSTHSPGLFSWFPMFFPLKTPIEVKKDDVISINFWRNVSEKKVHYEWCITSPTASQIHNPNGRTYWIGL